MRFRRDLVLALLSATTVGCLSLSGLVDGGDDSEGDGGSDAATNTSRGGSSGTAGSSAGTGATHGGSAGTAGSIGASGSSGASGSAGTSGASGASGNSGASGTAGTNGTDAGPDPWVPVEFKATTRTACADPTASPVDISTVPDATESCACTCTPSTTTCTMPTAVNIKNDTATCAGASQVSVTTDGGACSNKTISITSAFGVRIFSGVSASCSLAATPPALPLARICMSTTAGATTIAVNDGIRCVARSGAATCTNPSFPRLVRAGARVSDARRCQCECVGSPCPKVLNVYTGASCTGAMAQLVETCNTTPTANTYQSYRYIHQPGTCDLRDPRDHVTPVTPGTGAITGAVTPIGTEYTICCPN
ncbi:MAG: hypothetical protein U0169_22960 [Polyangiaceae bacterium]